MHFLLFYDYVSDYMTRRDQFRKEHLTLCWNAQERGELVLAGLLSDNNNGAVLFFKGESPAVAEKFAAADPYVKNGLVSGWRVRPWATVVGKEASTPVRPE